MSRIIRPVHTAEDVYELGTKFKLEMNEFHYQLKRSFNGYKTECYSKVSESLQEFINES